MSLFASLSTRFDHGKVARKRSPEITIPAGGHPPVGNQPMQIGNMKACRGEQGEEKGLPGAWVELEFRPGQRFQSLSKGIEDQRRQNGIRIRPRLAEHVIAGYGEEVQLQAALLSKGNWMADGFAARKDCWRYPAVLGFCLPCQYLQ